MSDMPTRHDATENTVAAKAESTGERFSRSLAEYACSITSVRNDVYTTQWWQFLVNFLLGGGALGMLIASMFTDGGVMVGMSVGGIAAVIAVVVFNYVLRSVTPASFLQYTYLDKAKDKRYCFQVLSKKRATFSDGENTIECYRDTAAKLDSPYLAQYRFDFFADMTPTERTTDGMRETYKCYIDGNGKRVKCKIVFVNGKPLYGSVGGARIKYFDVNSTKDKFVVPVTLKRAAKLLDIPFPKLPGLYIRDDVKDYTKQ